MTDVVERLEEIETNSENAHIAHVCGKAAETIDALRAENARLLEDLARRFEGLPETTWTSKDVAYVIRNYTACAAMGETE